MAAGISTFESEFLSHIVDPATNQTVGEVILPKLARSYESNHHRPLSLTFEPQGKNGEEQ